MSRLTIVWLFMAIAAIILPSTVTARPQQQEMHSDDTLSRRRAFDYCYLQALSLKEQGEHDAAYEMFEHCHSLNPSSPAVLFELSVYYIYLGKKGEALEMMKRAVSMEPKNFWYRQILATAYENNGDRDNAIAIYEGMAKDFPANSEIHLILSGHYAEQEQYEKAIAALNDYERKEGKSEQISMQKFEISMMMHDSVKAIAEVAKLTADNPDDLKYKVLLGDAYQYNGNMPRAYQIYKEVLSQEPTNIDAQLAMVNYHRMQGNDTLYKASLDTLLMNRKMSPTTRSEILVKVISEMEQNGGDSIYITNLCERLITLPENQLPTLTVYAQYLGIKRAPENQVTPLLQKILQIEPENRMAQLQLLSYAIARADYDDIIARADTAILYNPEMLRLYYFRGIAGYKKEKPEEAVKIFRQGLQKRSEDTDAKLISEIFTLIGDTEHEIGNMQATYEAYDSALIYDPGNIVVLNNYAYFLSLEESNLQRAEEMSFRTIKEEPENPIYIDTYMWILFKQKRYEEAAAYAEKLISTNEDMSAVEYAHCGDIFAMCGDLERALDCWLEAEKKGDESKILKRKIKKKKYIPDGKKKRKK